MTRQICFNTFDGIFIADVVGYCDDYKGSDYHAIPQAAQKRREADAAVTALKSAQG